MSHRDLTLAVRWQDLSFISLMLFLVTLTWGPPSLLLAQLSERMMITTHQWAAHQQHQINVLIGTEVEIRADASLLEVPATSPLVMAGQQTEGVASQRETGIKEGSRKSKKWVIYPLSVVEWPVVFWLVYLGGCRFGYSQYLRAVVVQGMLTTLKVPPNNNWFSNVWRDFWSIKKFVIQSCPNGQEALQTSTLFHDASTDELSSVFYLILSNLKCHNDPISLHCVFLLFFWFKLPLVQ